MEQWVKIFNSKGYQICVEKGVESGMPCIIFRTHKDGGILRSMMCLQPHDATRMAMELSKGARDQVFADLDQDMVDGAMESMLEMEPELMDGSVHGFVMEPGA
ncbi:hypothetical protein D7B12_17955 [Salmonella enterica]|nr:hypothetical protein [Salmonella enterica]